jgi:hypothetical protein
MNRGLATCFAFLITIFVVAQARAESLSSIVRAGDIVFQESKSRLSAPIQAATGSRMTHTGIVFFKKGKPFVFEAVGPVRYTELTAWVKRGVGGHVVVKRLKDADTWLSPGNLKRMRSSAKRLQGRPYDIKFEWSEEAIYCSELVFKVFLEGAGLVLGEIERIGDLELDSAAVQALIDRHRGGELDRSEPIITPVSIFKDPRLLTLFEGSI